MSITTLPVAIAMFPTSKPTGPAYGQHWRTTWPRLLQYIQQPRREGAKDGRCFAGATFTVEPARPDVPEGVERVRRLKVNLTARTLIALDIERNKATGELPPGIDEVAETVARNGWACAIYTSHNHDPDQDVRYRVLLPLAAPLAVDLPCAEAVADHLGVLGTLDTSKVGAASLFFFPSCLPGAAGLHECHVLDGAPIGTGWLLAEAGRLYQAREAERERLAAEAHAAAAARQAERLTAGFDPDDSLIERLRGHYDLGAVLEAHGYDRAGSKYRHPGSSSGMHGADIKVLGAIERVFSHNATDPLHADNLPAWCGTVTALDVIDVLTILDHGGDRTRALREMAKKHGLDKAAERKDLARMLFRLVRRNDPQLSIETAAYAEGERLGLTRAEVVAVARWVASQGSPARSAV